MYFVNIDPIREIQWKFVRIWYHIECYWAYFLTLLNIWKDEKKIPEGVYCYLPDVEKNKIAREKGEFGVYYTKPCPYYRGLEGFKSGCTYIGFIGDDMLLGDQCKICGENQDGEEE